MERVMRAVDASLTTLYVLTSPRMQKKVYMEDVIDRVVMFTKYQLHNTIYPAFDPVYRYILNYYYFFFNQIHRTVIYFFVIGYTRVMILMQEVLVKNVLIQKKFVIKMFCPCTASWQKQFHFWLSFYKFKLLQIQLFFILHLWQFRHFLLKKSVNYNFLH